MLIDRCAILVTCTHPPLMGTRRPCPTHHSWRMALDTHAGEAVRAINMRRVVTGHDAHGHAVVSIDRVYRQSHLAVDPTTPPQTARQKKRVSV